MTLGFYISLTLTATALLLTVIGKSQSTGKKVRPENIVLLAWNEDTTNSYQFALTKDKKFYYTIIKKDSMTEAKQYYSGTFKYSSDTLYLYFKTISAPKNVTRFLLVEASGNYLIQPLQDGKRIFLRLQRTGHRILGHIPT
jgi:hypothetical protein